MLYLNDGQNLFDPATAFGGNDWGLGQTVEALICRGEVEPLIIAGIYNTGASRIAEYTPVRDRRGQGGRARAYGRFIVRELKPFIDREYRTLVEAANTGLGGSSLGGLVALYLGLRYPQIFGKLIVMSPSVWWANGAILREVRKLQRKLDESAKGASNAQAGLQAVLRDFRQRIWLDIGTCEGDCPEAAIQNVFQLRDALVAKGWKLDNDLAFMLDEGAGHNEKAWGRRMPDALKFLFAQSGGSA